MMTTAMKRVVKRRDQLEVRRKGARKRKTDGTINPR